MRKHILLSLFIFISIHLLPQPADNSHIATATFYSNAFEGKKMANGNMFSNINYTAAYNLLPLGSVVELTRWGKKDKIIVQITDRKGGKGLDLSKKAFLALGFKESQGIGLVTIKLISSLERGR